ncbi:MAG: hypothetical protein KOO63_04820 [Bacteroidales bacterium]|nr:hypothetical protein [Candidatus Latescibacterota bacterium]
MQKSKGMFRGQKWDIKASVLLLLILLAGLPARASSFETSAFRGMGSTRYPERNISWKSPDADSIWACISVSCANPYSIPDLYVSTLGFSMTPGTLHTHADWTVLTHPLYRENGLRISVGTSLLSSPVYVGLCSRMKWVRIRGYPGLVRTVSSFHVGSCLWGGLMIEGEIPVKVFDGGSMSEGSLRMLIRTGDIDLLLNIDEDLNGVRRERIGTAVRMKGRATLLGGYSSGACSVTAGLMIRSGMILTAFSWEGHPVLGSTYSAGIVRMW